MASDKIPWDLVKKLAELYRKNPAALKTSVDGKIETLHGIRYTKEGIEDLLNQTGKNITELFIMPIVRPEDENKQPADQFFSFALAGIDDQNNLITDLVFEYGDPCPKACTANYRDEFGLNDSE
ncbi:hypothetical protein [Halocola ammonii]